MREKRTATTRDWRRGHCRAGRELKKILEKISGVGRENIKVHRWSRKKMYGRGGVEIGGERNIGRI